MASAFAEHGHPLATVHDWRHHPTMIKRQHTIEPTAASPDLRPLAAIGDFPRSSIKEAMATPAYAAAAAYFATYPRLSLMSHHARAVLFALIRMHRPQVVAEIGTLYAGTTEVLARALWENGEGILHTTDPFGAERCPEIIATWPAELRQITRFYPLSSMDFFLELERQKSVLDMVLVDGNHDYEFALFDLLMAARLLRPGGIVVMDNAEQSGPFHAARTFLAANPSWVELGNAVAAYDPSAPFKQPRASLPGTTFLLLQAPAQLSIGPGPHSLGQVQTNVPMLAGFSLDLAAQATVGTLHYQAILRVFAEGNRDVHELKSDGVVRLRQDGPAMTLEHRFREPLRSNMPEPDHVTFELEFSWQGDAGALPLALAKIPVPLA
jgi:predicted O-methyltransferase YrrM